MILSTSNYLLEFYLGSSVGTQLPFAVSWVDHADKVTLGSSGGLSNNTSPVTIVPAPTGTTKRQIQELSIHNPNVSDVTVTVVLKNISVPSFSSVRKKQVLKQKESLQYTENSGWSITELINDSLTLNKLTDVVIAGATEDQFLKYNGSYWENANLTTDDIGGIDNIVGASEFSALTDTFTYTPQNVGKLVYVKPDGTGLTTLPSGLFQPSGDYAYLSGASFSGDVTVFAHLAAVTKSFLIRHPFFPLKKLLRYACLEGPENGVYVRGRLTDYDIIELPDYWRKLVDPDSITVQLTPIGSNQKLFIKKIENNKVYIDYESFTDYIKIDCFYLVQAERCDVPKLIVEL